MKIIEITPNLNIQFEKFTLSLKLYKNRDTTEVKEQDTLLTNNENSRSTPIRTTRPTSIPILTTSQTIENSTWLQIH